MDLNIQTAQLAAELDALAAFSEAPAPAVTRIVFSATDRQAREYVKRLRADAGLAIREDAVGNTFARWTGSEPALAAVATGSHIDAIPNAGRYDGTVGVLGGLEAIRALQRSGFRPRRSIELVMFTSEEPTRFGIGCIGSRLLAGVLDAAAGTRLVGKDGETRNQWHTAAGFAGDLAGVRLPQGH
jgi:ureidoglycolate amidohydrolase